MRIPFIAALLIGLAGTATAQTSTPPVAPAATQAQSPLETALQAYEGGRLPEAARAFAALSARGDALGDYNLAMMHIRGEVPRPDLKLAHRLLVRAAAKPLIRAQLSLGQWHEQGLDGKRDLAQAVRWYGLAAEAGSVDGQIELATAYYLGRGIRRDMAQAAHWYREAAKAGDVGAQYLLATMYEQGEGVAADARLARYWYEIAARNGDLVAPGKLQDLDAKAVEPRKL